MFRFTIRDVLWAMVVVGVSVGWWAEHRQRREVTLTPNYVKAMVSSGQRLEFRVLPNGKIDAQVVPDR